MKKKYKKLMLFLSLCLSLFICLTVSSHAYYYNSDTGNLESSNLFSTDTSFSVGGGDGSFTRDNNSFTFNVISASDFYIVTPIGQSLTSGTYTFSLSSYEHIQLFVIQENNNWRTSSAENHTLVFDNDFNLKIRIDVDESFTGSFSFNLMVNSGSSALAYEPYGVTFYSQINYDNYGASQYSQGYTDGFNSIYNSLVDVNLSEHVTGIGCGIYNSTGTTFVQNGTITSSYFESNYYYFEVAPIIDGNYYVIPISFDNNYIFSSFRWSPNRFSSPSLTINGVTYQSSDVNYNGSSYGWDNLNVNLDSSANSVEFKFKINSNFDGLRLYINGKNLEIASALESYQSGYDNGQSVGYQSGYNDGFRNGSQSVTTDNSNFQKLIWTIGATPFESFKTIWDVDVMGLNISGIILGSLMALLVLYLIKKIWK